MQSSVVYQFCLIINLLIMLRANTVFLCGWRENRTELQESREWYLNRESVQAEIKRTNQQREFFLSCVRVQLKCTGIMGGSIASRWLFFPPQSHAPHFSFVQSSFPALYSLFVTMIQISTSIFSSLFLSCLSLAIFLSVATSDCEWCRQWSHCHCYKKRREVEGERNVGAAALRSVSAAVYWM